MFHINIFSQYQERMNLKGSFEDPSSPSLSSSPTLSFLTSTPKSPSTLLPTQTPTTTPSTPSIFISNISHPPPWFYGQEDSDHIEKIFKLYEKWLVFEKEQFVGIIIRHFSTGNSHTFQSMDCIKMYELKQIPFGHSFKWLNDTCVLTEYDSLQGLPLRIVKYLNKQAMVLDNMKNKPNSNSCHVLYCCPRFDLLSHRSYCTAPLSSKENIICCFQGLQSQLLAHASIPTIKKRKRILENSSSKQGKQEEEFDFEYNDEDEEDEDEDVEFVAHPLRNNNTNSITSSKPITRVSSTSMPLKNDDDDLNTPYNRVLLSPDDDSLNYYDTNNALQPFSVTILSSSPAKSYLDSYKQPKKEDSTRIQDTISSFQFIKSTNNSRRRSPTDSPSSPTTKFKMVSSFDASNGMQVVTSKIMGDELFF